MKLRRSGISVTLVTTALFFATAAAAIADNATPLGGSPLNVYVGERGQLQAVRTDSSSGIFFPSSSTVGDAGFFLAFPSGFSGEPAPTVWGFEGFAGPHGLEEFTPVSQSPVSGSGSAADPLKQVTTYHAPGRSGRDPDDHLRERLPGIPRPLGSQQQLRRRGQLQGAGGGRLLLPGRRRRDRDLHRRAAPLHRRHQPRQRVLRRLRRSDRRRPRTVVGLPGPPLRQFTGRGLGQDRGIGLVHRRRPSTTRCSPKPSTTPAASSGTRTRPDRASPPARPAPIELLVRSAVPSALQLNPTNAASRQGVPINITATALDSNGQPYAGKTPPLLDRRPQRGDRRRHARRGRAPP